MGDSVSVCFRKATTITISSGVPMSAILRTMSTVDTYLAENAPSVHSFLHAPPHVKAWRWFAGLFGAGIVLWALSMFYAALETPGVLLMGGGLVALGFAHAYTRGWSDRFAHVEHINTVITMSRRWARSRTGRPCRTCGVVIGTVVIKTDEQHPIHDLHGEHGLIPTALTYVSDTCGHMLGFVKVG